MYSTECECTYHSLQTQRSLTTKLGAMNVSTSIHANMQHQCQNNNLQNQQKNGTKRNHSEINCNIAPSSTNGFCTQGQERKRTKSDITMNDVTFTNDVALTNEVAMECSNNNHASNFPPQNNRRFKECWRCQNGEPGHIGHLMEMNEA